MIRELCMGWQRDYVYDETTRYFCLMAGRRAGKTWAIKRRLVRRALKWPGSRSYYLTPDGTLCNEVFRDLIESRAIRRRIRTVEYSPTRQIFWKNGSRTLFRMFDRPDKSLGYGFDEVIFDEIQKLVALEGKEAFMRVIMPLVLDRKGKMTIAGQWRGRGCWWFKWFTANKDKPKYRTFSLPSWEGQPFRKGKENHPEIQAQREVMPKVMFDQEIACIPTSSENAAFNLYDIEACFAGELIDQGIRGREYGIGADLGRSRDPSAWVVMDAGTGQVVYARRRPLGERHEQGAVKLAELSRKFNGAAVLFDATGGATGGKYEPDAFVKFYRRLIPHSRWIFLPVTIKAAIVQDLSLGIEQRRLRIPSKAVELIDELTLYECKYDGYCYRYHAVEGSHDDLVIGLALAWRVVTLGMNTRIQGSAGVAAALMG